MKILVTGANGFIGMNLCTWLNEKKYDVKKYTRENNLDDLKNSVKSVDCIVHLAGVNRPKKPKAFKEDNVNLTQKLCSLVSKESRNIPIIFTSSIQAENESDYGLSKYNSEKVISKFVKNTNKSAIIYRLPNVFGKWCKPDYNSVVATFCHNIANGIPIHIRDSNFEIPLIYIDDLVMNIAKILKNPPNGILYKSVKPVYHIKLGQLAEKIKNFKNTRNILEVSKVGKGLTRALYSTFISYLKPKNFYYEIPQHKDSRGSFVEMLKTKNSGQVSFFSAKSGVTRGEHYHHTKTEKFLVIRGNALFRFRNVITSEYYELKTDSSVPTIVDTIPGWTHDIKNIGKDEMLVMLWANEIFDPKAPDTYFKKI